MVTTHYPYIIPEGVVWSARTGRLMTVAEAAAELEAQGGGGGSTDDILPRLSFGSFTQFNFNDIIPAGWWLAFISGGGVALTAGALLAAGVTVGPSRTVLFHSDGTLLILFPAGIVAHPVTFT